MFCDASDGSWFQDDVDDGFQENANEDNVPPLESMRVRGTRKPRTLVAKEAPSVLPPLLLKTVRILHTLGLTSSKFEIFQWMIWYLIFIGVGKRLLPKSVVDTSALSSREAIIYQSLVAQMANPMKRDRVVKFIQQRSVTKRLINYFVVHFILHQEIGFYLDRRKYPHKIIGRLNEPQQPEILSLIQREQADIVWVNLHQEYKSAKNRDGRGNLHSPYGRSVAVPLGSESYSLCELNFYCWLDDVGGFEAFELFESEVRQAKARSDEIKRSEKKTNETIVKRPLSLLDTDFYKSYPFSKRPTKHKFMSRYQSGKNYRARCIRRM